MGMSPYKVREGTQIRRLTANFSLCTAANTCKPKLNLSFMPKLPQENMKYVSGARWLSFQGPSCLQVPAVCPGTAKGQAFGLI